MLYLHPSLLCHYSIILKKLHNCTSTLNKKLQEHWISFRLIGPTTFWFALQKTFTESTRSKSRAACGSTPDRENGGVTLRFIFYTRRIATYVMFTVHDETPDIKNNRCELIMQTKLIALIGFFHFFFYFLNCRVGCLSAAVSG